MSDKIYEQIIQAEEQLQQAMLNSDIEVLDKLLDDDLIFINHVGQKLSKQDDINAHKSGMLKITGITTHQRTIQLEDNVAVVTVNLTINGSYGGSAASGVFIFLRVWHRSASWRVLSGSSHLMG
jgi:ketosteroid isomerase-like protein